MTFSDGVYLCKKFNWPISEKIVDQVKCVCFRKGD
nr:MAG TPA: hypothetical protein [Caudoviricetes sp.]